jgi:transcription initiation factor TFIIIB Brf1 subunit/transcription initiation factor TFIIB
MKVKCSECGSTNHINETRDMVRPKYCTKCKSILREATVNPNALWEVFKDIKKSNRKRSKPRDSDTTPMLTTVNPENIKK